MYVTVWMERIDACLRSVPHWQKRHRLRWLLVYVSDTRGKAQASEASAKVRG
jgi:hypothetical protein